MSGAILILMFVVLMAVGIPIAVSMGVAAVAYMLLFLDIPMVVVVQQMMSGVNKFTLLAIPFFMMAGALMEQGGISKRIIDFAKRLLGSFPGGLALVIVFASTIFAAMTGAGAATVAAVGGIMLPAMKRENYDEDFTAALQATSGIFGPLIPPSILMVLYSVSTNVAAGDMLMAGLLPGILMSLIVAATSTVICIKHNYRGEGKFNLKEVLKSLGKAIWALFTPLIILGGIYSGLFTPTEAAAVAALYAMIVGTFVYRELNWKKILNIMLSSMKMAAGILLIVAATQAFSWVLTREQIPQMIAASFVSITNNPTIFLLLVGILVLFCGCFLDPVPAVMILAPILAPAATSFGINPIHFGVVLVIGLVIGLITPPVGVNLFVASSLSGRPIHKIVPKLIPFLIATIAGFIVCILVPDIATLLPSLLK